MEVDLTVDEVGIIQAALVEYRDYLDMIEDDTQVDILDSASQKLAQRLEAFP